MKSSVAPWMPPTNRIGHNGNTADKNLYFGNKDLADIVDDTTDETFVLV
jgi:hypothetical protein